MPRRLTLSRSIECLLLVVVALQLGHPEQQRRGRTPRSLPLKRLLGTNTRKGHEPRLRRRGRGYGAKKETDRLMLTSGCSRFDIDIDELARIQLHARRPLHSENHREHAQIDSLGAPTR